MRVEENRKPNMKSINIIATANQVDYFNGDVMQDKITGMSTSCDISHG